MSRAVICAVIGLFALSTLANCQSDRTEAQTTATAEQVTEPTLTATSTPLPPVVTLAEALPSATATLKTAPTIEPTVLAPTPEPVDVGPPEIFATASVTPLPSVQPLTEITLTLVAGGFVNPVHLTHAGDMRLFVVEQVGRIKIVTEGGNVLPVPFLDIANQVGSLGNEQGLLSVAFHPDYQTNGRFFVDYTDLNGTTVVSEFHVTADPNVADTASERILMTIDQPFINHNGGLVLFGPDGYLYIGMGDGGSQGDPSGNGQNLNTLLGTILRIDVDRGEPYAIPPDNPFVSDANARPEIWAYGVRNPWRFAFDPLTDDFFLADVGQSSFEEIDFVPAGTPAGVNFGWNPMEGFSCYLAGCNADAYMLPVTVYGRDQGCAVTGGDIYRSARLPKLFGHYFFADFCLGTIWSLANLDGSWSTTPVASSGLAITSFGKDVTGELYVVHRGGNIFQITSVE